jgi:hypothetical protein
MRTKGKRLGAMPPGFDSFDAEDLFGEQEAVAPPTKAELFRSSRRGDTFDAHGRRWKVVHDYFGPGVRTIVGDPPMIVRDPKGGLTEESILFAELDGDTLVVSNVNKRGTELRAVGKALWRERLEGLSRLGALPKSGRIPLDTAKRVLKRLPAKTRACGITPAALREGMEIEREHRDVTKGGVLATAKIAASHLCERSDYYKRIKKYVER